MFKKILKLVGLIFVVCMLVTVNSVIQDTSVVYAKSDSIEIPNLKSIKNTTTGIQIIWNKVSNIDGYAVFRKTKNSDYKLLNITNKKSYTDKTVEEGTTYYYTIRAYKGEQSEALDNMYNSKYWSKHEKGLKSRYLKTPSSLKITTNKAHKRTLKWKKVKNASGYVVYRKQGKNDSWQMIGNTKKSSYTEKGSLTKGKKYYYTVRAYKGKLKTAKKHKYDSYYWSSCKSTGVKFTAKGTKKCTSADAIVKGAVYENGRTSGGKLTSRKGVVWYHGHKETYYSQKVLPGRGLKIPGRHVNKSDKTVRDKNNYICVASTKYKKGTLVETSLGLAKVYDSGCRYNTIDIYTNW